MKKKPKAKLPPRPVQFRPGKHLSVTELYNEANELKVDLSTYLRALIRVGRKESKLRGIKKGVPGVVSLLFRENPEI